MRWMALRWFVAPFARMVFRRIEAAQSVIFAVAQYWNDESNDAVHQLLVISDQRDPTWPECLSYAHNKLVPLELPYGYEEATEEEREWLREEAARLAEASDSYSRYAIEQGEHGPVITFIDALFGVGSFLDDNNTLSAAFAEFCKPDANQGMDVQDAYTPYAIARRDGADVALEEVGARFASGAERYQPAVRADGPFELTLPSEAALTAQLATFERAQRSVNRSIALAQLIEAARALDDEERETQTRSANKIAALQRAIAVARAAREG